MRNRVNVSRGVGNGVQMIAVLLVVDMRLRVGNVIGVRFRMQMRLVSRWQTTVLVGRTVRLVRLNVSALLNAVLIDHSPLLRVGLLRIGLTLNVLSLHHLPLNHRTSRAIGLLILLCVHLLIAVGRDLIEMRRCVWDAINVSRRVRHRIDMIAMLNVINVRRRVRYIVEVGGGVGDAINMSCRVRHRIDMIAMLDVISVCGGMWHVVKVRGGVWHAPLGLSGSRQRHDGYGC